MNSNIYEYNASEVLSKYARFVEGGPNATVLAVSSSKATEASKNAIEKSAESIGYGMDSCAWLTLHPTRSDDAAASDSVSCENLVEIFEALDPVVVVSLDKTSSDMILSTYGLETSLFEGDSMQWIFGRRVALFNSFEKSLESPDAKQAAWRILKELALRGL